MQEEPRRFLDCRRCAACCHAREGTILVTPEDEDRWRRASRFDILDTLTEGHFGLRAMGIGASGACVMLGTPGAPNDCSIYDARSSTCREFLAGCRQCLEARRVLGLSEER
jgi:hypothetical protein